MKDSITRSVVKTVFFKIVTTSTTTLFMGLGDAILLHAILTAFYLVYERVWNKIKWGKVTPKELEGTVDVYFEGKSHTEKVARFEFESDYIACLPVLEMLSKEQGYEVVTESIN